MIQVQALLNYLLLGHCWMKSHQFYFPKRVAGRLEVYRELADRVATRKVLYLEFGRGGRQEHALGGRRR